MHGQFVIILGIPDTSRSFLSDFSLLGFQRNLKSLTNNLGHGRLVISASAA